MPRLPVIHSSVLPYHLVSRVNNRDRFQTHMRDVWDLYAEECHLITDQFDVRIHALLLMNNHHHMMATFPTVSISEVMRHFNRSITQRFNLRTGRRDHLFGSRYKPTLITDPRQFSNCYKYLYRNPVKAGICERVEDYRYSTLNGLLGGNHLPFPLYHPLDGAGDGLLPEDPSELLRWLNCPFKNEEDEAIRKALKRSVFKLPKMADSKRTRIIL